MYKWFLQHPVFPTSGIFSTDDTAFCSTLTIHFLINIIGFIIASNYDNFIILILHILPSDHSLQWPIFPAHSGTQTSSNSWSQHGFLIQFIDFSATVYYSLFLHLPLELYYIPIQLFLTPMHRASNISSPSLASTHSLVHTSTPIKTNFLSALHLDLSKCIYLGKNTATWVRKMIIKKLLRLIEKPIIFLANSWPLYLLHTFCSLQNKLQP